MVTPKDVDWTFVADKVNEHEFMSGVERARERQKETGEHFTPTALVIEILEQLPSDTFTDYSKTVLDPTCGDGQFLVAVKWARVSCGISEIDAIRTIYGCDIMQDNIDKCHKRLGGDNPLAKEILIQNVICDDSLNPSTVRGMELFGEETPTISYPTLIP